MTSEEKEYLEIVEKHIILKDDGSVVLDISDPALMTKYGKFLTKHAKKDTGTSEPRIADGPINIYMCYCPPR